MSKTNKTLLDSAPISNLQYATIFVCFLMNILDGMDVLVISFCAPAIAEGWGVSKVALGIVFSSGLVGMTIGALFLAPFADRIGRKKAIILSALLMGLSMFFTSYSSSVNELMIFRFISGLGIGVMLASTTALIAEYTPDTSKDFWVSAALSGYPIGAVMAGLVSAEVIENYNWQMMFKIAGIASLVTLPAILIWLSESIDFYLKKQPPNALVKVNTILEKMGRPGLSELPPIPEQKAAIPVKELLEEEHRKSTLQLWLALFLAFGALYFLASWIPALSKETGMSMSYAIYAGTVFNVGAFFGITTQGYFSSKVGLKKTIGLILIATAILMGVFDFFIGTNLLLLIVFGLLGFGIQGGFVGLYSVAARLYPTEIRTTGVGWAIGIGRLGGIAGPAIGGILTGAIGLSMGSTFLIFAIPTFFAGLVTLYLSSEKIT